MQLQNCNINGDKKLIYKFKKLEGIGIAKLKNILGFMGLSLNLKSNQLTSSYFLILKKLIEDGCYSFKYFQYKKIIIGLDLKIYMKRHKLKYLKNNHKKGIRLKRGLPIRGQRTCTNANSSKKFKI